MEYKFTGGKKQNNFYLFPAFVCILILGALIDREINIPLIYHSVGFFFMVGLINLYVYSRKGNFIFTGEGMIITNTFKRKTIIPFRNIEFVEIDQKNLNIKIQQIQSNSLYFQIYSQSYFDLLIPELQKYKVKIVEK